MNIFEGLMLGLQSALSPAILMYTFIGVFLGTLVGALPGVGALTTISLLLPITYHLPATAAIVMLAGIYYGAQYGGSTASILLNLPGTPTSAVTCLDGYPMARQGRAGAALFTVAIASLVGAIFGILMLILFAPGIAELGSKFGPAEYFAVMLLGLVAASTVSAGSAVKGLAMVVLGLILGTVGMDINSGVNRFDFDIAELWDGVSLVALAMGVFGVAEVIASVNRKQDELGTRKISLRDMMPACEEVRRSIAPILRGTGIGCFFGALPGTGGAIASFMSYAVEKRVAKDGSRFGKGAIEGVAAPEAANNAAAQTAFIPTLSFGIPGDVVMTLMLGALVLHGIQPGPRLVHEQPELFWGLVMSFATGNLMLVILNLPLIGIWVSMLRIPYRALYPAVLIFVCLGVYSVNNNAFDIYMVAFFGVVGYLMIILEFNPAPMLLGFVMGPMMEKNLRRALLLSRGDLAVFIERPISAAILLACAVLLVWALWGSIRTCLHQARRYDDKKKKHHVMAGRNLDFQGK